VLHQRCQSKIYLLLHGTEKAVDYSSDSTKYIVKENFDLDTQLHFIEFIMIVIAILFTAMSIFDKTVIAITNNKHLYKIA